MTKKIQFLLLGLLCSLVTGAWAQTVVYVDDQVRLGVRAEPNNNLRPLEVVTTGTALEVKRREGNYLLVVTPKGTEGWVNRGYISEDLPAAQQLEQLQERYKALQGTLNEWRTKAQEVDQQNGVLSNKLTEITQAHNSLKERAEVLEQSHEAKSEKRWRALTAWTVALLVVALTFFFLGALWYRHRASEKLGGLTI